MTDVTIIIRCRNNWALTKSCIDSIIKNTNRELYKLVVVDDGSTDETLQKLIGLQAEGSLIRLRHDTSLGAVVSTNDGLKYYFKNPTDYVMVLDNDTEILDGDNSWLIDLISYFKEDEMLGILGCVSDNVIGLQNVSQLTNDKEPKFLISFAWMMSLECAKRCGFFDERYWPGNFEDIDYCITATRNGFKLKVAKDVFIKHLCHQTFNQMGLNELVQTNEKKGLAKWGERIYYSLRK